MTDVIVQNLMTEEKGIFVDNFLVYHYCQCKSNSSLCVCARAVKLRCRDLVKKIAVFKNRLAVSKDEFYVASQALGEGSFFNMYMFVYALRYSFLKG